MFNQGDLWMILQIFGVFDILKKKEEDESIDFYIQRLAELQNEELEMLLNIGTYYLNQSNYDESLQYLEKGLRLTLDLKDEELEAFILDTIGDVHLNAREIPKALEYYSEALLIYRSTKSPLKDELVEKIKEVEKFKEAIEITELNRMSERTVPEIEEEYEIDLEKILPKLDILVEMVESTSMHVPYDDENEALIQLREAVKISKEIGDETGEASLLLLMGNYSFKQKKYDDAMKYFKNSREFFRRLGDQKSLAVAMLLLGTTNFVLGDIEGVSNNFRGAVEKFQKLDDKNAESAAIDLLNDLYNE
jgi:tetratricopeptide (TPR) repeat protein